MEKIETDWKWKLCGFRKYPYPPMKNSGNSEGEGILKEEICKGWRGFTGSSLSRGWNICTKNFLNWSIQSTKKYLLSFNFHLVKYNYGIWVFQGVEQSMLKNNGNSRGVGGFIKDPLERKFLESGGCKPKSLREGYRYFLEPHILKSLAIFFKIYEQWCNPFKELVPSRLLCYF